MSATTTSITPRQHPSSRRISQVYVEIPPSPYSRVGGSAFPFSPHVHRSTSLKENAVIQSSKNMLRAAGGTILGTPPSSLKRKLSLAVVINSAKKPKLSVSADTNTGPEVHKTVPANTASSKPGNPSEQFPNGSFTCHQCGKKRDLSSKHVWTLWSSRSSPLSPSQLVSNAPSEYRAQQQDATLPKNVAVVLNIAKGVSRTGMARTLRVSRRSCSRPVRKRSPI